MTTLLAASLRWQDHAVLIGYLAGMILLGVVLSRRQKTDEEYFLAGRRMPWFAVGISVIASLLSSLTYLSEPGEVWNSGITHVFGKMLAIPFEMALVWLFCIPFMMRFRFTSAYEYLEQRFDKTVRRVAVMLFILMVVLWMGFVVLASARALAKVSGFELWQVIATVGFVATIYTVMGGLRAVIWTDVIQVILLIGGGLLTIVYVAYTTGSWLPDWFATATDYLEVTRKGHKPLAFFSFDPMVRATIVTVALNMCVWHVCTHIANQMTVQRYFSTKDLVAARRSFVTGTLFGVGINLMLVVVGLSLIHFFLASAAGDPTRFDAVMQEKLAGIDIGNKQQRDLIFPTFSIQYLYPGFGGAILAALLAAAMSSIDSGVNSIATVVSVEISGDAPKTSSHVAMARRITVFAGLFITCAAYGLNFLPSNWGIVDAMPRTFNAITAPLGGIFLAGMMLPFAGRSAVLIGCAFGMATSLGVGYFQVIAATFFSAEQLAAWGWLNSEGQVQSLSFTWVMPCALLVMLTVTAMAGIVFRSTASQREYAWWGKARHQ